jgi:hypothetical protein
LLKVIDVMKEKGGTAGSGGREGSDQDETNRG